MLGATACVPLHRPVTTWGGALMWPAGMFLEAILTLARLARMYLCMEVSMIHTNLFH